MKTMLKYFCLIVVMLLISDMCSLTAHAVVKNIEKALSPEEEYYLGAQLAEFIKQMHENPDDYVDPKTGKPMDELAAFQAYKHSLDTPPPVAAKNEYSAELERRQQEQRNRQIQAYMATPIIQWSAKPYEELAQREAERNREKTGKSDKTWDNFLAVNKADQASYAIINSGTVLPAMLLTGLNSDLPGHLLAQVSENIYDSPTGKVVLIPQGSRLFGEYDSKVIFGQKRALIKWYRLIYPDGSALDLEGMAGVDKAGYAGFKGSINNHFGPMLGSAMMVSVFAGLANEFGKDKTTIQLIEPRVVVGDTIPVGTIIEWPNNQAPDGYLLCSGDDFDSDSYSDLANVLGSSTLPDLNSSSTGTYRIIKAKNSISGSYSLGSAASSTTVVDGSGNAVGEELSKTLATMTEKLMEKYLEMAPTLKIAQGYRFSVICNREIVLPAYVPTWH